ncbi:MAG: 4Fe-4S dicluster domain-containing protein [Alphaproteobacteria bacterium]|nr:4Fe-4S dicluster domain-containing protein [Alphaproteobacteria bacterium]
MTALPALPTRKRLGLVIDLDTCVGCHACAVACKEWNAGGYHAPLTDERPYAAAPSGIWFNRIHSFEVSGGDGPRLVHFPKSCLHCDDAPCVTVCPTGASYKRAEDGIVLVEEDLCIGCKLCSWACPYGAREYDSTAGVMKKCTLCIDRIYNETLDEVDRVPACVAVCPVSARHFGDLADPDSQVSKLVAERGGCDLMPEMQTRPVNQYLPPRPRRNSPGATAAPVALAPAPRRSSSATGTRPTGRRRRRPPAAPPALAPARYACSRRRTRRPTT